MPILFFSGVESNWPHALLELLTFTAGRVEGRRAIRARFGAFIRPYEPLLKEMRVVKVAGTNGKGSVCAMLEACLGCAGQRVGLFTSPHLSRITERFRIAGAEVSLDALDGAAQEVLRAARLLAASEAIRLGRHFGFEAGTLLNVSDMLGGAEVPKVLAADVATRRFKTGLQLGVLKSNVELAAGLAERAGLVLPLLDATSQAWSQAERQLGYGVDHSEIIRWLESLVAEAPEEPAADQSAK